MVLKKRKANILGASILVLASLNAGSATAQDNTLSITNHEGTTTTLTSMADGHNINVQDARGISTLYRFNSVGQLEFEDAPERGITQYSYDYEGRAFKVETEGSHSSTLVFDKQSRVKRRIWRQGDDEKMATRYTYDTCDNGENRLCKVVHGGHVTRYGYTADNKLAFVKSKLSDEDVVETIRYRYKESGLLESMRYPSGLRVIYRYDDQGRVTAMRGVYETTDSRESFTILRAISYDEATGRVIGYTHGNGVKTRYRFDAEGLLERISNKLNGDVLDEDIYSYNQDGIIDSIDRLNTADSRRYNYDGQGRLIHEAHGDGTADNMKTVEYSYDSVGNRLARIVDGREKNFDYAPGANQLQSGGLSYDARGNLIEDYSKSQSFSYDITNRMDAFYRNGELRAQYDYDVSGRRTRKRLHRLNSEGVKSVRYLYDTEGRLVSETSRGEGRRAMKARDLIWFGSIPVAQIERRVNSEGNTKKTNILSLHADYLGAPRQAKDESGTTVWSWYGDAFGAGVGNIPAINRDPDGDGNKTEVSLRFPGQYHDRESNLWYNHHRDYDPKLGRYIQSDPIGLAGGSNRYAYVSAKPTYLIDPNGLAEVCFSLSTGYTPNSSGQGRAAEDVPADIVVTGRRNSPRPNRRCIQFDDPVPNFPPIPFIPPTPPVPSPPPAPNDNENEEPEDNCPISLEELNDYLDRVLGRRSSTENYTFAEIAASLNDLPQSVFGDIHGQSFSADGPATVFNPINFAQNSFSAQGWHHSNIRLPSPDGSPGGYHLHTEVEGGPVFAHFDAYNGSTHPINHLVEVGVLPTVDPHRTYWTIFDIGPNMLYNRPGGPTTAAQIAEEALSPNELLEEVCEAARR